MTWTRTQTSFDSDGNRCLRTGIRLSLAEVTDSAYALCATADAIKKPMAREYSSPAGIPNTIEAVIAARNILTKAGLRFIRAWKQPPGH